MKGSDIRRLFLDFFASHGHSIQPSSPLVIHNDPTILFTNAGMNQFKDRFLGAPGPYTRATSSQKCLRISGKHNDFENVGVTARHHTFFEMLGNFSFGDYFKRDAIGYAWEFVTKRLNLERNRLWVTIYEQDEEAANFWKNETDLLPGRIIRLTAEEIFWSMGDTGPCGPCSEIHYYRGNDLTSQSEAEFRKDDGSYAEFWNLVFMQYNKDKSGNTAPLPSPCIDTGMGLERVTSFIQNVRGNYETDLLRPIISKCEELSGYEYQPGSYEVKDLRTDKHYARNVAMRVIADHSRAASFLIADGIIPGNDGQGYILRRLIRRAVRHARTLLFKDPFFQKTASVVIDTFGSTYPELIESKDKILTLVDSEERKFYETLDAGLSILNKEVERLSPQQLFPGKTAFLLHDTYGFPLDLTEDALKAYSRKVDIAGFDVAMNEQRTRSREERKAQGITFTSRTITTPKTVFLGYDSLEAEAKVQEVFADGDILTVVLDSTPFYGESGGQVGDTGTLTSSIAKLAVIDTQKTGDGHFLHHCELESGDKNSLVAGTLLLASVDKTKRAAIQVHHSATHLLHSALKKVLGDHIKQAGSRVSDTSLRFDFTHFSPMTEQQLIEVQSFVNYYLRENFEVNTQVLPIEKAKELGATALFGEKYGTTVRVVGMGPESLEFCGGTHVKNTGNIGFITILQEGGVSSGVRRIECVAGAHADKLLAITQEEKSRIFSLLKTDSGGNLFDKIEKTIARQKVLERELDSLRGQLAGSVAEDLLQTIRTTSSGLKVIVEQVSSQDIDTLKGMVDTVRNRIGSGIVALGSTHGDTAVLVAGSTQDLAKKINIGTIVKEAIQGSGGKGGGRPDFAQAGGVSPEKLSEVLATFFKLL